MTIPKIYLETTMFSFYYETRLWPTYQIYKGQVRRVFDLIKDGKYEPFTSPIATNELAKEQDRVKRENMEALIKDYGVKLLNVTDEVERLAGLYVQEEAVSPAWAADAAHIAITAINGLDFIVSLNFTHIARVWTIERVRRVNVRENYKAIGIYKPVEVLSL